MIRKTIVMISFVGLVAMLFAYHIAYSADAQPTKDVPINSMHRLALDFNEAINRCIQTKCSNIDELMGFLANDATVITATGETERGKAAIRKGMIRRTAKQPEIVSRLQGLDVWDQMIVCRVEDARQFSVGKYKASELSHHVDILVVKNGKITRWVTVTPVSEK